MLCKRVILLLVCILNISAVFSLSSCTQDLECASLAGSVCKDGSCVCPAGQQAVLGGTLCRESAPYYTSPCVEDHQCSNLVTGFICRRDETESEEGSCHCQSGFHYFRGRCWGSRDFGSTCASDVECQGVIRDPFSMSCVGGVCGCAAGYYQRQRGECRKIAGAVGENCVINEDCQFTNGVCDINTFRCYENTVGILSVEPTPQVPSPAPTLVKLGTNTTRSSARQHGLECDAATSCPAPFVCSAFGGCVCPAGYYASADGNTCLAQLGSPATEVQCVGLFAEIRDGVCTCQANFFFEEDMRDCTKVSRRISDACVSDANCHTFGATARCGPPQEWYLRSCECDPELSVWDANRDLCRLFAGIGEYCEVDGDCMAGDMQIECQQSICVCPDGYTDFEGLCLTTGLHLGDSCQANQECTATENTICEGSRCSCAEGYQEVDDFCAPTIGGSCEVNTDCAIENTICISENNSSTCQCNAGFITYGEACWPTVSGFDSHCLVSAQCVDALGSNGACDSNRCVCADNTHYRDGGCWSRIGLFEGCSRSSECFLQDMSDRVVCRNSLCQCHFDYPYSEVLHTCTSGATAIVNQVLLIVGSILFIIFI